MAHRSAKIFALCVSLFWVALYQLSRHHEHLGVVSYSENLDVSSINNFVDKSTINDVSEVNKLYNSEMNETSIILKEPYVKFKSMERLSSPQLPRALNDTQYGQLMDMLESFLNLAKEVDSTPVMLFGTLLGMLAKYSSC